MHNTKYIKQYSSNTTSQVSKIRMPIIHVLELTTAVFIIQLHNMQIKSTYIVQLVKSESDTNCEY